MRPQKIILIRHCESKGNIDHSVYAERPDYALELSERGTQQALDAGNKLAVLIGKERLMLYVSPHWRTRMTSEAIVQNFAPNQVIIREEPRIREQEWGHLRSTDEKGDAFIQ